MKAKKIFKGMTAAAIAAVLTASMVPMTAFAISDNEALVTDARAISLIDNSRYKGTYSIYRVIGLDDDSPISPDGKYYNYVIDSDFTGMTGYDTVDKIAAAKKVDGKANKALIDAIVEKAESIGAADMILNSATDGNPSLAPGYYLITFAGDSTAEDKGQMVAAPTLVSVTNTVALKDAGTALSVDTKTESIDITKSITNVTGYGSTDTTNKNGVGGKHDTAQVAIGDKVSYSLDTTTPVYSADKTVDMLGAQYKIVDTPSAGLTIKTDTLNVSVGGENIYVNGVLQTLGTSPIDEVKTTVSGTGFTITFNNAYVFDNQNENVVITFDAEVNNNAAVNTTGNDNTVYLTFDNKYYDANGNLTLEDDADVYTTQVTVNKKDGNGTALEDAEFELYEYNSGTKGNKLFDSATATGIKNTEGTVFTFKGLAKGKYLLVESKVPDGYKKAADKIIEIGTAVDTLYDGNYTYTVDSVSATDTIDVTNYAGQELPGTGGVGTTIFTIAGVGVVLVAGAMLVVYMRKRRTEDEE